MLGGYAMTKAKRQVLPGKVRRSVPVGIDYAALLEAIAHVHADAQRHAVQAVNLGLTLRNWAIGYYIVEYEQHGSDRANYGEKLLPQLAADLRRRVGKGFTQRNLEYVRLFYQRYPIAKSLISQFGLDLSAPVSVPHEPLDWQDDAYFVRLFRELPWTNFIELSRIDDPLKRAFYEVETLKNHWSVRELKRQMGSLLYERVGLSLDKQGVLDLARQGQIVTTPAELVRDPYVFDRLELPEGRGAGRGRAASDWHSALFRQE
jgi:hypothetical protein